MVYSLPPLGKGAVALPHFPTRLQAFIFRAYEYVPAAKIAEILGTCEENIHKAATDMGLTRKQVGDIWLTRGYITIIRRMWHILPYSQLMRLLDMDENTLATIMRNEDFLDIKLSDKPICEELKWRELTEDERERTLEIRRTVSSLDMGGVEPFNFKYDTPRITFGGKEKFESRIIYGFSGLYQRAFEVDSREFLPDSQLAAYKNLGINGIWMQGVLSQLALFPFDSRVSEGYEARIERMRELTERLSEYGIKLYLYINEPRSMPLEFFRGKEEIRGHVLDGYASLCTSTDTVKKYLSDSIESICKAVPKIGGFFTITRSENQSNCYSHSGSAAYESCNCPRCKKKSIGEVIGDTVGCILDGARRVSPDIKVFAWSWRWDEHNEEIIKHLPQGVILISQSELDIPFEIGGVSDRVVDYSMSIIGPGERARREWELAKQYGLQTGSKVQISTTWEASTVPALPVAPSVEEHIKGISEEGVSHLLLSWTLGGYPCRNIAAAAKYFYEKCSYIGESPEIEAAQRAFSEAFREFPFKMEVLYLGVHNAGPSNLLYSSPTGYTATMTCFAYDDLKTWRNAYSEDAFEGQFALLCEKWEAGLRMLRPDDECEIAVMARAAYCLFKSSLNQIRFIRARDSGRYSEAAKAARDELEISEAMLSLMNKNAAIGYEAANHYYFSKGQLAEKVLNCRYMIKLFGNKS